MFSVHSGVSGVEERWTHDVPHVLQWLPSVLLVVVPEEISRTPRIQIFVLIVASEIRHSLREMAAHLVQELAYLQFLHRPVKHVTPHDRVYAKTTSPFDLSDEGIFFSVRDWPLDTQNGRGEPLCFDSGDLVVDDPVG